MEKSEKYRELMQEKIRLLAEVLRVTHLEVFTGKNELQEHETERFIILYERRKNLFDKIQNIDRELKFSGFKNIKESGSADIMELQTKINAVSTEILKIDKKNAEIAPGLLNGIKDSIRNIKIGKNAAVKYQTDVFSEEGFYFDKKN